MEITGSVEITTDSTTSDVRGNTFYIVVKFITRYENAPTTATTKFASAFIAWCLAVTIASHDATNIELKKLQEVTQVSIQLGERTIDPTIHG